MSWHSIRVKVKVEAENDDDEVDVKPQPHVHHQTCDYESPSKTSRPRRSTTQKPKNYNDDDNDEDDDCKKITQKRPKMSKEEKRRKQREFVRAKRKLEDDSKRKERLEKDRLRKRQRRANMSEEEMGEERRKQRELAKAKRKLEDDAKRKVRLEKGRLWMRQKWAKMTTEQKAEIWRKKKDRMRQERMQNKEKPTMKLDSGQRKGQGPRGCGAKPMDDEARRRKNERQRENRLKMTLEQKKDRREREKFRYIMKSMEMTEEDKARRAEYMKNYHKKNRDREKSIKKQKLYWDRMRRENPEKFKEKREELNAKFREKVANETPEQRQRRLYRMKVYQAKKKLRKDLEEIEVPEEEIQRRLDVMAEEMWKEVPQLWPRPRQRRSTRSSPQNHSITTAMVTPTTSQSVERQGSLVEENNCLLENDDDDFDHFDDNFAIHDELPFASRDDVSTSDQHSSTIGTESKLEPEVEHLYHCKECDSTFTSEDDVKTHFILIHTEKCWRCPKCSELLLNATEFSEHYKEAHILNSKSRSVSNSATIKETETNFQQQDAQTTNQNKTNAQFKFSCLRCLKTENESGFDTLAKLSEHVEKKHRESFWPCDYCQLLKYSETSLRFHKSYCGKKPLSSTLRKRQTSVKMIKIKALSKSQSESKSMKTSKL